MGQFSDVRLTRKGLRLQAKAQTGTKLVFKGIVVGRGYLDDNTDVLDMTELVEPVNDAVTGIVANTVTGDGYSQIDAMVKSGGTGFYLREIGLIATDPDEGDILYSYANAGDYADFLPAEVDGVVTQYISIITVVGNAEDIDVNISAVAEVTREEFTALKNVVEDVVNNKTETVVVTSLPSTQESYNFENNIPLFSAPSIGETVKGISETVRDTENDGYYQRVCSTGAEGASTTIGSTSNVYSQLKFSNIAENATDMTIELDFQYVNNGRIKLALCDLDVINELSNSDIRYNTSGVVIDLFSNSDSRFQVNGNGNTRTSFFGAWLHGKFEIDFMAKTVKYTIFVKDNESDSITGTTNFRDPNCSKITGIALYTWLANDTILFDNIKIVSRVNVVESALYILEYGNGTYQTYKYIYGEPVLLAGEDLSGYATKAELANGLSGKSDTGHTHTQLHTHSNKSVLDGITAAKVEAWDAKSGETTHTHANKTVLDGITSTKMSQWDTAYSQSHAHSNKTVLDGITSDNITNWDGKAEANIKKNPNDTTGDIIETHLTVGSRKKDTIGVKSFVSGNDNSAPGGASAAVGGGSNTASGEYAVVVGGMDNRAIAPNSAILGGNNNIAAGGWVLGGNNNTAPSNVCVTGHYSSIYNSGSDSGTDGDAFVIGNGNSSAKSNAFRVAYNGSVYGAGAYNSTGADIAELYEWLDGNPDNEDRRGLFVTLDGTKIKLAEPTDTYIKGVISAAPALVGDSYSDTWHGMYLMDVFGVPLKQTVHHEAEYTEVKKTDPETGEETTEQVLLHDEYDTEEYILNPDYDPEQEYIPREQRQEYDYVSSWGKLVIVDDGTCEVNGFATVGEGGKATKSDTQTIYRVMERKDDTHIFVAIG